MSQLSVETSGREAQEIQLLAWLRTLATMSLNLKKIKIMLINVYLLCFFAHLPAQCGSPTR